MDYRCRQCVTPDSWPGIQYTEDGTCNLCKAYEARWGSWLADEKVRRESKQQLDRIIENIRRAKKGEYDVLVPISGGKDSLYALWYLKNEYDLKILCYTYDNGLFAEAALENMTLAVEKTGTKHIFESHSFQHDLVRHFLSTAGNFCGACVIPYLFGSLRCARKYRIPLVVFGLSTRVDANLPDGMNPFFFKNVLSDGYTGPSIAPILGDFPTLRYTLNLLTRNVKPLNLPDYLEWNDEEIKTILSRDWNVTLGVEHADCIGHEVADWLATKRYGFGFGPIKLSQRIRAGEISRQEAIDELPHHTRDALPYSAADLAKRLHIDISEIENATKRDFSRYHRGLGDFLSKHYRNYLLGRVSWRK